jgi:diphosphomevalonate decarboxylase
MSTPTQAHYDSKTGTLSLTATSPINIALIKYWGKVHEDMIIPANSSLSITIDQNDLCSKTKVELVDPAIQEGREIVLILNGKEEKISSRMKRILEIMRTRTQGVSAKNESGNTIEIPRE